VADGELQAVLGDQLRGGGLVVDRQGHDPGSHLGELVLGPLESAQLRVAVRAPGATVEQDHAEVAVQRVRQLQRAAADLGHGEGRELIAGMEQRHENLRTVGEGHDPAGSAGRRQPGAGGLPAYG
jgi:hypothetical protein